MALCWSCQTNSTQMKTRSWVCRIWISIASLIVLESFHHGLLELRFRKGRAWQSHNQFIDSNSVLHSNLCLMSFTLYFLMSSDLHIRGACRPMTVHKFKMAVDKEVEQLNFISFISIFPPWFHISTIKSFTQEKVPKMITVWHWILDSLNGNIYSMHKT